MGTITNTGAVSQTAPRKWFIGWPMVALGWVGVFCCGTITYAGSYINSMMVLDTGMSQTIVGYCGSLISLFTVLLSTVLGSLMVKYSHRTLMLIGLVLALAGFCGLAFLPTSPVQYVLMYIPLGLSVTLLNKIGGPSLANTWFNHRKSIPVALMIAAGSFGGIFAGPIRSLMNATGTWRTGWMFMIGFAIISIICMFFVRDDVHALGEIRDGKYWCEKHGYPTVEPEIDRKKVKVTGNPFKYYKNGRFFFLSFSCFIRMAIYATGASYITLTVIERGLTAEEAALTVVNFSLASTIGRIVGGFYSYLHISHTMANRIAFFMCGVGGILLCTVSNVTILSVAVILIGAGYGVGYTAQTMVISDFYPKGEYATLFGAFSSMVNVASVVMGTIAGWVGAVLGMYSPIYLVLGIVCIVFGLLFGLAKPKTDDVFAAAQE